MQERSTPTCNNPNTRAFTLIELLVVIAILSALLAILVPSLRRVRNVARRIKCASNLKGISGAWLLYLDDNDGYFFQEGRAVQVRSGGWIGKNGEGWWPRPINPYLLSGQTITQESAKLFCCPADRGGLLGSPPGHKAYVWDGTSYSTNILLVGSDQVSVSGPDPNRVKLHQEINRHLPKMNITKVSNPHDKTILVGDSGWYQQFLNSLVLSGDRKKRVEWHDVNDCYNIAFLGGNVGHVKIKHGVYLTDDYYVLPFDHLNSLARRVK